MYPKRTGECVDCEKPCEQCRKCNKEYNYETKEDAEKNCAFPLTLDNGAPVSSADHDRAKHPSAYFCTKCFADSFFPAHITDLTDIEMYVSETNNMLDNLPKDEYYNN